MPEGPFGAKGIGELAVVGIAPAIGNAIYDALKVRIKDLPLFPERVLIRTRGTGKFRKHMQNVRKDAKGMARRLLPSALWRERIRIRSSATMSAIESGVIL